MKRQRIGHPVSPRAAFVGVAAALALSIPKQARAQNALPGSASPPPPAPLAISTAAPLVVPEYPSTGFGSTTPAVEKERYSSKWMTIGVLMTTVGLAATIAGSMVTASAIGAYDVYCDTRFCGTQDDVARRTGGTIMMVSGAIIGGVGFPLWLIGARRVPVTRRADVFLSPRAASIRVAF